MELHWHFIGPVQSNKTHTIASLFHWVHSVDREKVARRLNEQRPENLPPLNICLQVNSSGEKSKSGIQASELTELASRISENGIKHHRSDAGYTLYGYVERSRSSGS
jgi:uncharacterized pyridoxal phosphate-containing UPF0001 family protein